MRAKGEIGCVLYAFQARHIGLLTSLLPRSRARTFCALWAVYSPISCHQCISTCSELRCQRAAVRIILVRLRNVSWLAGTSSVQRDEDISNFRAQRLVSFGYPSLAIIWSSETKPFTIGFAIASSPLAILAYIGEKIYSWSDPERVDQQDILETVALYYLSGSFASSVVIYHQVRPFMLSRFVDLYDKQFNYKSGNLRNELTTEAGKWQIKGRIGYSAFVSLPSPSMK